MGSLLFLMALACLKIYLNNIGMESTGFGALLDALFPFIVVMPVGPLIYFYVKSHLEPEFRFQRKDRIHFYPVIIDLLPHACSLLLVIAILTHLFRGNTSFFGYWYDEYNTYGDIPRWASLSVYLFLSLRLIRRHAGKLSRAGGKRPRTSGWLKELLWVFLAFDIIWTIFLVPYVIEQSSDAFIDRVGWYPLYLPIVVMIYWLGIRGYLMRERGLATARLAAARIPIPPESLLPVVRGLQQAMEVRRLYLDPDLSLAKLAGEIGIAPKLLSTVLNQHLAKSFNEYVNEFRVMEIKLRLLDAESQRFTIASIAYDCGFNSLPTFQRAFKNIIGLSPKEFLLKHSA